VCSEGKGLKEKVSIINTRKCALVQIEGKEKAIRFI